jgi:hypothetical protein
MGTDGESPHRICKPEVTGSIPVRSTFVRPRNRDDDAEEFPVLVVSDLS